jgi:hypothetical protein
MADGQLGVNLEATSPGIFFKNSAGNLVKVGPVHVGTTAPNVSPAGQSGNSTGEQWLDITGGTYNLKIWDGSAWRSEAGEFVNVTGDTMTGALAIIAGSASTPGLAISGDSNTGIYSPGADQLALTTGGTQRLTTDTAAVTSTLPVVHPLGAAATPSITFTGDLNTGIYSPGADQLAISTGGTGRLFVDSAGRVGIGATSPADTLDVRVNAASSTSIAEFGLTGQTINPRLRIEADETGNVVRLNTNFQGATSPSIAFGISGGSERARIDSSGRLLVGTSTTVSTIIDAGLQVQGTGANAYISSGRWSASANSSGFVFNKSRGANVGTRAVVQSADTLGEISFTGDDGTNFVAAASIFARVDGTPGTNDMPGRLVFSTTEDGASTSTERLRITNDGVIAHDQLAPAAVNATATLTIANLKAGIITSTSAAATDMTLPTGTDTEAGFNAVYTNFTFEWSVINTGPSLVRVLAGTAHTVVGSGSVATGTSGRFASRRTAANTFVTYRLS